LIVVFTAFTIAATAAFGGVAIAAIAVAIVIAAPTTITVAITVTAAAIITTTVLVTDVIAFVAVVAAAIAVNIAITVPTAAASMATVATELGVQCQAGDDKKHLVVVWLQTEPTARWQSWLSPIERIPEGLGAGDEF
jgi:hypothetical protein